MNSPSIVGSTTSQIDSASYSVDLTQTVVSFIRTYQQSHPFPKDKTKLNDYLSTATAAFREQHPQMAAGLKNPEYVLQDVFNKYFSNGVYPSQATLDKDKSKFTDANTVSKPAVPAARSPASIVTSPAPTAAASFDINSTEAQTKATQLRTKGTQEKQMTEQDKHVLWVWNAFGQGHQAEARTLYFKQLENNPPLNEQEQHRLQGWFAFPKYDHRIRTLYVRQLDGESLSSEETTELQEGFKRSKSTEQYSDDPVSFHR